MNILQGFTFWLWFQAQFYSTLIHLQPLIF